MNQSTDWVNCTLFSCPLLSQLLLNCYWHEKNNTALFKSIHAWCKTHHMPSGYLWHIYSLSILISYILHLCLIKELELFCYSYCIFLLFLLCGSLPLPSLICYPRSTFITIQERQSTHDPQSLLFITIEQKIKTGWLNIHLALLTLRRLMSYIYIWSAYSWCF